MGNKVHDLVGTNDTIKVVLTNSAPNVATHVTLSDVTQVANGGGYTTGGEDTQNSGSESGGTLTVTATAVTWTGSGGGFGPFQYIVAYNDTPTSPADPLIAYWNYGSSISVAAGETFTWTPAGGVLMTHA